MVHRSIRNDPRIADALYIKRLLLMLEDFLFCSLYSVCCIAKHVTTFNSFDSCLGLIVWYKLRTLLFAPFPLSHPRYQYHLRQTLPITLERVHNITPDVKCAYIPPQGEGIVPNHALFPVGFTYHWTMVGYTFATIVSMSYFPLPDLISVSRHIDPQFGCTSTIFNVLPERIGLILPQPLVLFWTRTCECFWKYRCSTSGNLWGGTFGSRHREQSDIPSLGNMNCT